MDTLSEKSPNQGETPGDDKIDREIKELEANSIIAGHSLKDTDHLSLHHNEPSNKSHTSEDVLDFHKSASCNTVEGSTPDTEKKSDDSTTKQNNTSDCEVVEDDLSKTNDSEQDKSFVSDQSPAVGSHTEKFPAQTIESESPSDTLELEASTSSKESVAETSVENPSSISSCPLSPAKSTEEFGVDAPSPIAAEQELVDISQADLQPSPMQSLLTRPVKAQCAPTNAVHVNGGLSSGSLQVKKKFLLELLVYFQGCGGN